MYIAKKAMDGFLAYKKFLVKLLKTHLLVDLCVVFFSDQSVTQYEPL